MKDFELKDHRALMHQEPTPLGANVISCGSVSGSGSGSFNTAPV
jgi:hypothetical protein